MKILRYLGAFLIGLILGGIFILPAQSQVAPTITNTQATPINANVGIGTFTTSINTFQVIYTAPTAGAFIKNCFATNYDTVNTHNVTCREVTTNATPGLVGVGFTGAIGIGTTSVNLTLPSGANIDAWGNPYLDMPNGYTIQCAVGTAVSNNFVAVDCQGAEFK